jgi:lysophospholipase L1-like esterase
MSRAVGLAALFVTAAFSPLSAQTGQPLKIAIAGDSTVATYKPTEVLRGWGQLLPEFFAPGTQIDNFAKNGRSTKTFRAEGLWQKTLADRPDFVFIQFGHNDSHTPLATHPEGTVADGDYLENLRLYVSEARAAGSVPILVTPMHRRTFLADGTMTRELLPYVTSIKKVAAEMKVPLVDLYADSGALFEKLGDAGSAFFTPKDRTHFSEKGARVMAFFVARDAAKLDERLQKAEVNPLPDPTVGLKAGAKSAPAGKTLPNDPAATIKTEVAPK